MSSTIPEPHPSLEPPYELILLDERFLAQIINLQEVVVGGLKSLDLFEPSPPPFFQDHIRDKGRTLGILSGGSLVAFSIIAFPNEEDSNLGNDLSICKEELSKVAHLECTVVHQEHRGKSLQGKLIQYRLNIASSLGYHHICSTVSPKNYPSLNNLLKHGLVIRDLKIKYDGKLRYILYKNMKHSNTIVPDRRLKLKNIDTEGQKKALSEGFLGYKICSRYSDYFEIIYMR